MWLMRYLPCDGSISKPSNFVVYSRGIVRVAGPLMPVCELLISPIIALPRSYTSSFVPAKARIGSYRALTAAQSYPFIAGL